MTRHAIPATPAADAAKATPSMAQFLEIKAANPDSLLFYRMGDFYELFFADAEIASRTLGIVLTKRGKHNGADIRMCGVPVHRADEYLQRLIAAGHRVAVCEQLEDPVEARKRGSKSVVRRDVVRLVTPGTITEEALLEPARANLLVSVARQRADDTDWLYGLAAVDISTGAFSVCEVAAGALAAEIARLDPREIVLPDTVLDDPGLKALWRDQRAATTPLPRAGFDGASAERRLADFFNVATLAGFGAFSRAELAAAAGAIHYVEKTQLGARPPLSPPRRDTAGATLRIDAATRANLELTRTLAGDRAGSLLGAIDRTVSPAGGRLLAERLAGPLTDPAEIGARLDAVACLVEAADLRAALRTRLAAAPDAVRALARLSLGRGGPRDLAAIRDFIEAGAAVADLLHGGGDAPRELAEAATALGGLDPAIAATLAAALADDLPLLARDGGLVRPGHSPEIDETRALRDESRRVVAALQARYAEETGVRTLRIKHNNFLGYYIEAPQAAGESFLQPPWRERFIHRQTMAGAMRFSTTELGELEARIASAADRAVALEREVFEALTARVLAAAEPVKAAAAALAAIDVAAALAEIAADLGWTRPVVDNSLAFVLEGARHPVVEAALKAAGDPFVANGVDLSPPADAGAGRILVVTGPNMAGKSTYLRQCALVAVLAQAGSFAPARRAHIGVVDRLFSRVGAADDLARGRSTFMVEMIETAAILNQATDRSLVILDEIGRGTATFDGLSIAWATIEHLHDRNRSRTLFATHFHELTRLAARLPRLANATMRVADFEGEVIFLHEVIAGAANRSYGIQVARLAGLPPKVVARAKSILAALEAGERGKPSATLVDDLPLFAAAAPAPAPAKDALRDLLATVEPDELTPRQALEALYALKRFERGT